MRLLGFRFPDLLISDMSSGSLDEEMDSLDVTFKLVLSSLSVGRLKFLESFGQLNRYAANAIDRQKARLQDDWQQTSRSKVLLNGHMND